MHIPHDKLSVLQQLKRIFTPFNKSYYSLEVGDCFFYPQRFVASLFLSTFSVGFLVYKALMIIINLSDNIANMSNKVLDAYVFSMNNALQQFMILYPGANISQEDYQKTTQYIQWLGQQFVSLADSMYVAFMYSNFIFFI